MVEGGAELKCLLDNVQGLVDALSSVRWKKQQVSCLQLRCKPE